MHTGPQRKYVIRPINRLADGCLAREQGKPSLLNYLHDQNTTEFPLFLDRKCFFVCKIPYAKQGAEVLNPPPQAQDRPVRSLLQSLYEFHPKNRFSHFFP